MIEWFITSTKKQKRRRKERPGKIKYEAVMELSQWEARKIEGLPSGIVSSVAVKVGTVDKGSS